MRACRIAEASIGGIESLVLENEHLEVSVLVGKGTDIFSFRHRASGTDFLWKAPWGVRDPATTIQDTANSAASFLDYYFGGWQELFPNAGAGCTYRGAELGVHGEACKVPWSWQIKEETSRRISVRFRARMVRTPFLLEKQLTLEAGRATLLIEESVTNEGADAVDFIWGHHPALGAPFLSGNCRLYAPARVVETDDSNLFLAPQRRFESYPMIETADGDPFDISRIPPPSARVTMQSFLRELAEGWYAVVNQETGLGFAMSWDLEVFPLSLALGGTVRIRGLSVVGAMLRGRNRAQQHADGRGSGPGRGERDPTPVAAGEVSPLSSTRDGIRDPGRTAARRPRRPDRVLIRRSPPYITCTPGFEAHLGRI